jgi:inner membrane protein
MMAGSHVAVGAAAWVLVAPHFGMPGTAPLPLALAIGGALLPDIDHPRSWIGRRCGMVSRLLARVVSHRGFTHSLLAVALCLYALQADGVSRFWVAPLLVGYLSHLAADLLTPAGLRLAWPLRQGFSVPLCRTGSPAEPVIVLILLAVAGLHLFGRPM